MNHQEGESPRAEYSERLARDDALQSVFAFFADGLLAAIDEKHSRVLSQEVRREDGRFLIAVTVQYEPYQKRAIGIRAGTP